MRWKVTAVLLLAPFAAIAEEEKVSVELMPPVVVRTIPEAGATDVDPATTEIRAVFSKPMMTGNYSWVRTGKETFPETTGKPRFDKDERTCILPVRLQPGKTYVLWLNQGEFSSFMDKGRRPAVPYLLVFQTRKK